MPFYFSRYTFGAVRLWGVLVATFLLILLGYAGASMEPNSGGGMAGKDFNVNSSGRAVPAMFIFGDSTVDSGNNNKLFTIARANFPPYGRDFDTRHATGRFSNGRVASDFVAEFLRVPMVKPYLSPEANMDIYQGVNFASAGAGIRNRTGNILGMKISQWQQMELFLERRRQIVDAMGEQSTKKLLMQSLYYVAIGGNDFIHNYFTNDTEDALLAPDVFTDLLLSTLKQQLQLLFNGGARKLVVLGTGPIGCLPHFISASNSTNGECLPIVNDMIQAYNHRLALMVNDFNQANHGSHAIYRDVYRIVEQMSRYPRDYGFTVGNTACCGIGRYGGADRCLTPQMVCDSPKDYVWWDLYHPSHRASQYIASQLWQGTDPPLVSSDISANITFMNIQELVAVNVFNESA